MFSNSFPVMAVGQLQPEGDVQALTEDGAGDTQEGQVGSSLLADGVSNADDEGSCEVLSALDDQSEQQLEADEQPAEELQAQEEEENVDLLEVKGQRRLLAEALPPTSESQAESNDDKNADPLEEEKEPVHADGWADEVISGKKVRVYYRAGAVVKGYQTIDGVGYFFDETTGALLTNSAVRKVDGKLFLFNDKGVRVTGSGWKDVGKNRYLLTNSIVQTGWKQVSGCWFYLDASTAVLKRNGTFTVGGKTYLATATGECPPDSWVKFSGKWYLTDKSRVLRSGWYKWRGAWYFFDTQSKAMKSSQTFTDGGQTYIADASGVCPSDTWVRLSGKWYLTNGSRACRSGWQTWNRRRYYLDPKTKVMKCNEVFVVGGKTYIATSALGDCPPNKWLSINGIWYFTGSDCAARTGWAMSNSRWYYLNPNKDSAGVSGKMYKGLLKNYKGKNYFLSSTGAMVANDFAKLPDGTEHYAEYDGALCSNYRKNGVYYNANGTKMSGWHSFYDRWYYMDGATGKPKTGWIQTGGKWYWLNSSGQMVTGRQVINGKVELFTDSGAWIDTDSVRRAVVNAAYSQIGYAYSYENDYYGAYDAFNCSGFSYWCYLQAGYTIPRKQGYYSYYWNENNMSYSQMWWVESRGNWTTNVSNLRPGDLVFFSPVYDKWRTGHVGVYVGNSMMIDAYPGYGVSVRSVYQSGFVGGGSPIF